MPNNIAKLRIEHGLNQKELGDKIKVGQTTISAWETGKTEPDNETLKKLSDIFYVNIGYITGHEIRINRNLTNEEAKKLFNKKDLDEITQQLEDEEIKEKWQLENPNIFFETYILQKASELMTSEQRMRLLSLIKAAFPKILEDVYQNTPQ